MEHQVINNNRPHPFWIWLLIVLGILAVSLYKVNASNSDTTYVVKGVVIDTIKEENKLNSYCSGFYEGFDD